MNHVSKVNMVEKCSMRQGLLYSMQLYCCHPSSFIKQTEENSEHTNEQNV